MAPAISFGAGCAPCSTIRARWAIRPTQLLVNNSWGSGMAVDETLARRMIADSAQLGLEMFHLDAGWFRDVGDWQRGSGQISARHRERRRLCPPARPEVWPVGGLDAGRHVDRARRTQCDRSRHAHWLIADPPAGWKHSEPFKGITIDLGVPAAEAWAARELERIVSEYHLDMLEHDGYLVAQGSSRGSIIPRRRRARQHCASMRIPDSSGPRAPTRPT